LGAVVQAVVAEIKITAEVPHPGWIIEPGEAVFDKPAAEAQAGGARLVDAQVNPAGYGQDFGADAVGVGVLDRKGDVLIFGMHPADEELHIGFSPGGEGRSHKKSQTTSQGKPHLPAGHTELLFAMPGCLPR
jgi:hypothetical protein